MGNFLSANSEKIFSNPSKPGFAQCDINQISYARRNLKLSWGQWPSQFIRLTSVDDVGKISWINRAETGGGSLWNYFFYSLLLGDNIKWGGGGLNSVNQGSPLMRVILYKNGTQWVKAEPIQKKLRPTTQGGIYWPTLIYIFTYVGQSNLNEY